MLKFRMLGPLEVLEDGTSVELGGLKQRAVLAILLSRRGEVVPITRLIDEVWGDDPPSSASNLIQGYVSGLRKRLGKDVIATRGTGYVVAPSDGAVDLREFERYAAIGSEALEQGRSSEAATAFGSALALWRGPALSDLADEPFARPIVARLDELRLVVTERRLEAELERGRAADVGSRLEGLVDEPPLRGRVRVLQMLALYRSGRQSGALDVYRTARAVMVERAGIEPGPALQELEKAILRQDVSLAGQEP